MEVVLSANNLVKNYGEVKAVNDISFELAAGEVLGLLGPNGAGKTTTIQMLLGLLEPTSGVINILEKSLRRDRFQVLKYINFAATYAHLPGNLSVRENLLFFSYLYGVPHPRQRTAELLRNFALEEMKSRRTGLLSSGEQSRLNLAKAFVNRPRVLLLDEPTASLDPDAADQLRKNIMAEAKTAGTGILWTSHNMYEMEKVCDRIIFLSCGRVIASGTPVELVRKYGQGNLEQTFIALARESLNK